MIQELGAIQAVNIEADDALGIMQTELQKRGESSVICSIDKDLKMIPGDHYNLTTFKNEIISKAGANTQFALQLLTGDMTDNIQGLTRVGQKTAEKILATATDPKDRVRVIREKYNKQFKEKGEARFKENVKLLKILKKVPEGQKLSFYDKSVECHTLELTVSEENDGFTKQ